MDVKIITNSGDATRIIQPTNTDPVLAIILVIVFIVLLGIIVFLIQNIITKTKKIKSNATYQPVFKDHPAIARLRTRLKSL